MGAQGWRSAPEDPRWFVQARGALPRSENPGPVGLSLGSTAQVPRDSGQLLPLWANSLCRIAPGLRGDPLGRPGWGQDWAGKAAGDTDNGSLGIGDRPPVLPRVPLQCICQKVRDHQQQVGQVGPLK